MLPKEFVSILNISKGDYVKCSINSKKQLVVEKVFEESYNSCNSNLESQDQVQPKESNSERRVEPSTFASDYKITGKDEQSINENKGDEKKEKIKPEKVYHEYLVKCPYEHYEKCNLLFGYPDISKVPLVCVCKCHNGKRSKGGLI